MKLFLSKQCENSAACENWQHWRASLRLSAEYSWLTYEHKNDIQLVDPSQSSVSYISNRIRADRYDNMIL